MAVVANASNLGGALAQLEALAQAPWLLQSLSLNNGLSLVELQAIVFAHLNAQQGARLSYSCQGAVAGVYRDQEGGAWKYFIETDASGTARLDAWIKSTFQAEKAASAPPNWSTVPKSRFKLP